MSNELFEKLTKQIVELEENIKELSKLTKTNLNLLREEVKLLSDKNDKLTTICSRMDTHIDFVEDTYENLKNPLNFISSKFNSSLKIENEK